jgi:hypothetical protein
MARVDVSMLLSLLLASHSAGGGVSPIGMVIHADRAHVGVGSASPGTTLYEGDHLTTDAEGELAIRNRAVTLQLEQETNLTLGGVAPGEKGIAADLETGTVVFSSAASSAVVVRADGAVIRTGDDVPTIARVRVVSPKELRIFAQRGALDFSYRDASETITEGACYRVLLDVDEGDDRANPGTSGAPAKKVGGAHRACVFISIAVGAAVAAGVARSHLAHPHPDESPERP